VLVDFGAGTGAFAVQAAGRCAEVHAVDVSEAMLARARQRAKSAGVANVAFHCRGFLTFERAPGSVDAVATSMALHHLPDLWKGVALTRMHAMLRPGGRLFIRDVILEQERVLANAQALIDKLAAKGGDSLKQDMEVHLRGEFSTYDWVMDGLLERAGFEIRDKAIQDGVIGAYLCLKPLPAA
jgi:putative AdoMet-dependent methyltransferase